MVTSSAKGHLPPECNVFCERTPSLCVLYCLSSCVAQFESQYIAIGSMSSVNVVRVSSTTQRSGTCADSVDCVSVVTLIICASSLWRGQLV